MKKTAQSWIKKKAAGNPRQHSSLQAVAHLDKSPVPDSYAKLMKPSFFESLIPRKLNSVSEFEKFKLNPHSLNDATNLKFYNKLLPEIYYEMHDRGANYFYASLVLSLGEFLGFNHQDPNQNQCVKIAAFIEMMHNTFLVYDDFCDDSHTRQGKESVVKMYGAPLAITSCIQAWYQAQNILLDSLPKEIHGGALKAISQALQNISFAQNFDLGIKIHGYIPSEEEYANHSVNKFYSAHMGADLLFLLSDTKPEVRNLFMQVLDNLAISYHIRDDILNLIPSGVTKMKSFIGEDIYEQKPSFLVIHSHNQAKNSERLQEILNMGTRDERLIQEAIEIMEVNGSFKYAREQAKIHAESALIALEDLKKYDKFGGHDAIQRIVEHITSRTY